MLDVSGDDNDEKGTHKNDVLLANLARSKKLLTALAYHLYSTGRVYNFGTW